MPRDCVGDAMDNTASIMEDSLLYNLRRGRGRVRGGCGAHEWTLLFSCGGDEVVGRRVVLNIKVVPFVPPRRVPRSRQCRVQKRPSRKRRRGPGRQFAVLLEAFLSCTKQRRNWIGRCVDMTATVLEAFEERQHVRVLQNAPPLPRYVTFTQRPL